MSAELDALLTADEAARLLRVHPLTIRRLGKAGDLAVIRPTGKRLVRFRRADVLALIERRSER